MARRRKAHGPASWRTALGSLLMATALAGGCSSAAPRSVGPDPALSPTDVVRLQVEALSQDEEDAGIALAFRFASPANRESTGPLARFVRIVRAPAYLPMLDPLAVEYGESFVGDRRAAQVVTITARDGSLHVYLFELSRQSVGDLADCWMTDSVRVLARREDDDVAI